MHDNDEQPSSPMQRTRTSPHIKTGPRPETSSRFRHSPTLTAAAVALPTDPARVTAAVQVNDAPSPNKGVVLVVDDQAVNRVLLCRMLSLEGYSHHTAASGDQAMAQLEEHPEIELVLLDLYMPGIDGIETTRRIRALDQSRQPGVILVTSSEYVDDVVRGLDTGADDYLTKPVVSKILLARMRSVLGMRQMQQELRLQNETLQKDLTAAQELQLSIIPQAPQRHGRTTVDWRYIPSMYVGGDMLDIAPLSDSKLGFYLADVSGHGVAAAMLAVWVYHFLRPRQESVGTGGMTQSNLSSLKESRPDRVLQRLDQVLDDGPLSKYLTAMYGVLDLQTGKLIYAIGGHPRPLLLRRSGELELLDVAGVPVGMGLGMTYECGETLLRAGDRLFIYSDGLTEAQSETGEMFGDDRLVAALHRSRDTPIKHQLDGLLDEVIGFSGCSDLEDDVSLMALQFTDDLGGG